MVTTENPLHHQVAGGIEYNRINNAEVLPGVMTAASWSFWDESVERAFRRALFDLGILGKNALAVPQDPAHRLRAVFFGRIATNISHHRAIARLMPSVLQTAFIVHLFADEAESGRMPSRRHAYLWRMPWLVARLPKRLRAEHHAAKTWWRRVTAADAAPTSMPAAIAALRAAHTRFERAMALNIATSLLSSTPVQQIMALAKSAGRSELAPAVISGYGTEEALMAQRLSAIAGGSETVNAFLQDFGFHGQAEGQLHRVSWREAPDQVRSRAASFGNGVAAGRSLDVVRAGQRSAETDLLSSVDAKARLKFNLWLARRLAPLREITKAWYLMTIDAGRAALRQIGTLAAQQSLLDTADDIFHLTLAEITEAPATAWRAVATKRRAEFQHYHSIDIPERFTGMPDAITTSGAAAARPDRLTIKGVGVSAGIAEGIARVVREVDGVDDLMDGEILICRSTDPSWAPAFMIASAVVIDIGSLLSHGAIVARELGLPCVVNAGNATTIIRTGDFVRVDGGTGLVEVAVHA